MVLFWWAASRLHREPSATNIQEHLPLPLQSTMRYAYLWFFLFCVLFTIFSLWHSLRTLDTNNTSDCRSIYMMNRKNVLYRFNRSSKACSLSSNDVSLAAIVSAIVSPLSQIWSFFTSCLMVVSFFSPPPARQPAPAGLCQIVYYISPESELLVLGILIEFVQLSLSFHTA